MNKRTFIICWLRSTYLVGDHGSCSFELRSWHRISRCPDFDLRKRTELELITNVCLSLGFKVCVPLSPKYSDCVWIHRPLRAALTYNPFYCQCPLSSRTRLGTRSSIGYNMECRQRSQLYSELIPGALLLVVVFLYEESFWRCCSSFFTYNQRFYGTNTQCAYEWGYLR